MLTQIKKTYKTIENMRKDLYEMKAQCFRIRKKLEEKKEDIESMRMQLDALDITTGFDRSTV